MDDILQLIKNTTGLSPEFQLMLFKTAFAFCVGWILNRAVIKVLSKQFSDNVKQLYYIQKTITYAIAVFLILTTGLIWFKGFQNITTYLGLLSAGIAVALRDPFVNLAGWLFIVWRRPFEVGDRIEIGKHSGDVIDVRIFQFTLFEIGSWVKGDQNTGRIIHIPNAKVFSEPQTNYSKGFPYIWNEIPVLITFESDWKKAKQILKDIAHHHSKHLPNEAKKRIKEMSHEFMIFHAELGAEVYTSVLDSGVLLTIRYLCEPKKRRNTEQDIWEEILTVFHEHHDLNFAYPTQRFYKLGEPTSYQPGPLE